MTAKESSVFTTGDFYGNKASTTVKYCFPYYDKAGVLKWRTRTWFYWRKIERRALTMHIISLKNEGMIYFPNIRQGQAISEYQQRVLKKNHLLDDIQLQLRKV